VKLLESASTWTTSHAEELTACLCAESLPHRCEERSIDRVRDVLLVPNLIFQSVFSEQQPYATIGSAYRNHQLTQHDCYDYMHRILTCIDHGNRRRVHTPLLPCVRVHRCHYARPELACFSSSALPERGLSLDFVLFCITCEDSGDDIVR
jgi:hypothetical protein